jgi:hypothetical protein
MSDFTAMCREEWGPQAIAKVHRTAEETPSFWIKCFNGSIFLGGVSIEEWCNNHAPGTDEYNPERNSGNPADEPWLKWECVPK